MGAIRYWNRGGDLPCDIPVRFGRVSRKVEPLEKRMPQSDSKSRRDSPYGARTDTTRTGCGLDSVVQWGHESAQNLFFGIFRVEW